MAHLTIGGNPVNTNSDLPAVGSAAPSFSLIATDLSEVTNSDFAGKNLVLNIFPSIDTPTCQASVRAFNERAADLDGTAVLCVSADLPFAQKRFCGAENIDNVTTGSTFRGSFLDDFGLRMVDGRLIDLAARAVVVVDASGTVIHSQLVPELADEPDYDAALGSLV